MAINSIMNFHESVGDMTEVQRLFFSRPIASLHQKTERGNFLLRGIDNNGSADGVATLTSHI